MENEVNVNGILLKTLIRKGYVENKDLFREFHLKNINYAVVKGEPLSLGAYQKLGKRVSNDIDILITRNDIKQVEDILMAYDFLSDKLSREEKVLILSFSHQTTTWKKNLYPYGTLGIDLNFDIFWGEYIGKRIDMTEFLSDTIYVDIYGVMVKTLNPVKSMVQLILHHYKEMNSIYHIVSHNCINYNMFQDVYYLWKNNRDAISLSELYSVCTEHEIFPYAYYVLYFTNQIFNDKDLSVYVDALKCEEGIRLLNYYGLANDERKLWKVDFKTRLATKNLYGIIKNDLTEKDLEKIEINRRIFK